MGQLFNETEKLISEQTEITAVNTINFKEFHVDVHKLIVQPSLWRSPTPKPTSSPTLCFVWGKMGDDPIATWKSKIKWYSKNNHFKDMNRIDGMPTEFEWNMFPGTTTLGLLEKIQSLMRDLQCELEHFKDRIIFMSMYNDIAWQEKGNTGRCEHNQIPSRSLIFLGDLDQKRNGTEPTLTNPTDLWDKIAENMMTNFSESGHPMFRAFSAFKRGELRSKVRGNKSFHFNGSNEDHRVASPRGDFCESAQCRTEP